MHKLQFNIQKKLNRVNTVRALFFKYKYTYIGIFDKVIQVLALVLYGLAI